jgi:hypothetical protein
MNGYLLIAFWILCVIGVVSLLMALPPVILVILVLFLILK